MVRLIMSVSSWGTTRMIEDCGGMESASGTTGVMTVLARKIKQHEEDRQNRFCGSEIYVSEIRNL